MDKYVRVEAEHPPLPLVRNEVRIMTDGKIRNYIKYATALLLVRSNGGRGPLGPTLVFQATTARSFPSTE